MNLMQSIQTPAYIQKFICLTVLLVIGFFLSLSHAQGWMAMGTALAQKTTQDGESFKTSFNPDIEIGGRIPFSLLSDGEFPDHGDWKICGGFGLSFDMRITDIKQIDWTKNKDYKCLFDIYAGPSLFFPFSDEHVTGLLLNPFVGYSFSGGGFSNETLESAPIGAFSVKVSAMFVFHRFAIGAAWRPLKQHVEGYTGSTFKEFEISPAFEIRIGVIID